MPPASSCLVTGAGSGLGRAFALALASPPHSMHLTISDIDTATAQETVAMILRRGGTAQAITCDVRNLAAQRQLFQAHLATYKSLDVVILNAGVGETTELFADESNQWQRTLDIDLTAVIEGTKLAVQCMRALQQERGRIVTVASAAGIYPMPVSPVYAAAKGGLVHFTRSLTSLQKQGIVVTALCPQFADTALVRNWLASKPEQATKAIQAAGGNIMSVDQVVAGLELLLACNEGGSVLFLGQSGAVKWWPFDAKAPSPPTPPAVAARRQRHAAWLAQIVAQQRPMPSHRRVMHVERLSSNFAEATSIVSLPLPATLPPNHVLMKRLYCGINASDINFAAGRYHGGPAAAAKLLPLEAGFEAVGVLVGIGPIESSGHRSSKTPMRLGQPVATMTYGGFADYVVLPLNRCLPVPEATPSMLALLTSGLTASISLEQLANVSPLVQTKRERVVLVTAAAGGVGQFAVQLARLASCRVIATCSGAAKAELVRSLGASDVIDYAQLAKDSSSSSSFSSPAYTKALRAEMTRLAPGGLDVVFESIGGSMFDAAAASLAPHGTLLVIGMMGAYKDDWPPSMTRGLPERLLMQSASVRGFFLPMYARLWAEHLERLGSLVDQGQLRVVMEEGRRFMGLESVVDAVNWLQSGKSMGKVYVDLVAEGGGGGERARL